MAIAITTGQLSALNKDEAARRPNWKPLVMSNKIDDTADKVSALSPQTRPAQSDQWR
jgi:hypothetical protein